MEKITEIPKWDTKDPSPNLKRLDNDQIEAYEIHDLLDSSECEKIIDLMNKNHIPSTLATSDGAIKNSTRTSSSAFFDNEDPFIKSIEQKISEAIGIDVSYGEPLQGQIYKVGEYYAPHLDYFNKKDENIYNQFCGDRGNRTWTMVIYLNDEGLEGGETNFPKVNVSIKPKRGKAACFRSMNPNGRMNRLTLHSGQKVTKGSKYIITKWFRENPVNTHGNSNPSSPIETDDLSNIKASDITEKHYFSSIEELPYLDKKGVGFEKRKLPEHIWKMAQEAYDTLLPKITTEDPEEKWITSVIADEYGNNVCDIMSFDLIPEKRNKIHEALRPIVQEWIGEENPITPSALYGIRSYQKGAILDMHSDNFTTHHAGCIVMVDKKIEEDWALHCVDHNGETHKVYLEPGEFALYECAKTRHGRPEPLIGDWFRNFFVHYKLDNWEYKEVS
ncbi:MAG: 2OG-Fe(II) oxygenase [Pelagibacterales bacterium]|nr:2OG-Fe(II) oxygenase [Pelagibacterales bacterium]